ncbi:MULTISPECIES: redox-sensitive transcriptional activator SoxR [Streptomyces]|uniref:redox-sensitive transcriptional activator SoxR n=1 Tax=Streptomyces TaxID=1883 RepID=UPI00148959F4|nr:MULTISPECIES: redox-sensitive transcriptional activator SoxR [Streptomyces]
MDRVPSRPPAGELTMGELSARSGVRPSALRFYESEGLIHSRRTSGNQRRYRRDTLRRVAVIRTAQAVGLSLAAIREAFAELPQGRTPTRRDWARLAESWQPELDARIRRLRALRQRLTECIGCGCLSLEHCTLSNPEDVLSRQGPGARRLT